MVSPSGPIHDGDFAFYSLPVVENQGSVHTAQFPQASVPTGSPNVSHRSPVSHVGSCERFADASNHSHFVSPSIGQPPYVPSSARSGFHHPAGASVHSDSVQGSMHVPQVGSPSPMPQYIPYVVKEKKEVKFVLCKFDPLVMSYTKFTTKLSLACMKSDIAYLLHERVTTDTNKKDSKTLALRLRILRFLKIRKRRVRLPLFFLQ